MPRKIGSAIESEFDARITPVDQKPIPKEKFESHLKDAIQVIVCEEGESNGTPKLHYHLYIRAKISESTISKILATLGGATAEIKGNAVFSLRKAHEHTIGYIIKCNKVVYSTDDQYTLEKYFQTSESYRKTLEANKKRASRTNEKTLSDILKEVEVDAHSPLNWVVQKVLEKYTELDKKFPPRSMLEVAIMKRIFPYQKDLVVNYYSRNIFDNRF